MAKKRLKGEPFDWQELLYRNSDPDFPELSPGERDMVNNFCFRVKEAETLFARGMKKQLIIVGSGATGNSCRAINGSTPRFYPISWPDTHIHPSEEALGGYPKELAKRLFDEAKTKTDNMSFGTIITGSSGEIGTRNETEKFLKPSKDA